MRGSGKRWEAIERNPKSVRFEELDALLLSHGFARRQSRGGSSHFVYERGKWQVVVPLHRPHLKPYAVAKALRTLADAEREEGEDDA